ncbi:MAG: hypothetical protein AABM67_11390 [Acidobacteriota bacterium]
MILNQDRDTNTNQLNPETKAEALLSEPLCEESDTPLFLKENDDSKKCDAQDEKDNTKE